MRNGSDEEREIRGLSLPSGSNQLRHMKMPLVEALWREKNPVELLIVLAFFFTVFTSNNRVDHVRTKKALTTTTHYLFAYRSARRGG